MTNSKTMPWLTLDEPKPQQELRLATMGADPYKQMASEIFGVPYDKVTKEQRLEAKTKFFASTYGMSYDGRNS